MNIGAKLWTLLNLIWNQKIFEVVIKNETIWQRDLKLRKWENHVNNNKPFIYKTYEGIKIKLYPEDLLSKLIFFETFEKNEREFVSRFLKNGDTFIDIGANIGLFTLIAGKKVGINGRVISFEPTYQSYQRLEKNIILNNLINVNSYNLALSSGNEVREFNVSTDGHAAFNTFGIPAMGDRFSKQLVKCITWDYFANENNLIGETDLIKLDVEGWELNVLLGGEKIFSGQYAPNLLVEFTDENAKNVGSSCALLFNQLSDFGYRLYSFDCSQEVICKEELKDYYNYTNLLATKREKDVLKRTNFKIVN